MATKLKTRPSKDIAGATEILVLVDHPMHTGTVRDPKTKELIKAHWIQKMTIAVNGKAVAEADLNVSVSKDPLVAVASKAVKKGDKVSVNWTDSEGKKDASEVVVA
jgi:sulfur-oxidizing protein SoxZ